VIMIVGVNGGGKTTTIGMFLVVTTKRNTFALLMYFRDELSGRASP